MKTTNTTNTINTTNIRTISRIAEENLKKAIFAAAKDSEPTPEQIAKDKKWCEEGAKLGSKRYVKYSERDWYKKLMENLEIAEEYNTGSGNSKIDIVESVFRLAEFEEDCLFCKLWNHENFHNECMKLIANAGLGTEYDAWKKERQVYDRNGRVIRVGDIIRFPDITAVCGRPVENGFEAEVEITSDGVAWIAYPQNAYIEDEHLRIPGVLFTAELAACAEVIIRREEGFIRHPYCGDFIFPRILEPGEQGYQIFVKKS